MDDTGIVGRVPSEPGSSSLRSTEPVCAVSAHAGDDPSRGEEPDLSWVLIAVARGGRNVVILDYSPGWSEFSMEFYWEDTFACDAPSHLSPGAYLWTGYKISWWDEDEAINASGGTFARDRDRDHEGDETAKTGSVGGADRARAEGIAQVEPS